MCLVKIITVRDLDEKFVILITLKSSMDDAKPIKKEDKRCSDKKIN